MTVLTSSWHGIHHGAELSTVHGHGRSVLHTVTNSIRILSQLTHFAYDDDLRGGMKVGNDAVKDYEKSLQRQLEFYLWLQSEDGPIAGGGTNSMENGKI